MRKHIGRLFAVFVCAIAIPVVVAAPPDDRSVLSAFAGAFCSNDSLRPNDYFILDAEVGEVPEYIRRIPVESGLAQSLADRNPPGTALPTKVAYRCLRLVDSRSIKKIFASEGASSWKLFYKSFPGAKGLIQLTLPGYSSSGSVAGIVVASTCDLLCGGGSLWLFERDRGNWTITKRMGLWIS